MKKYKILSKLLAAILLIQSTTSYSTAAVTGIDDLKNAANSATGSAITESSTALQAEFEEPEINLKSATLPENALRKAKQGNSIYDNKTYTHADVFDGMNIYNGIDVSYYNKTIDWDEVKAAGTDFAIIRVGYRGYGASGTLCTDTKFVENIEGALNAGIKVGVYYFTEAINTDEAIEEAKYCIEKIKNYDVTLPIVIDYEYPADSKGPIGRMYNAKLSKTAATRNVASFCDTVKNAGYTPMVYANKSDLSTLINGTTLAQDYKIWLANYNTKSTYTGTYEFWQYSEKGTVDGITGVVDCNFWYTSSNGTVNNNTPTVVTTALPEPTVTPTLASTPTPKPTPVSEPVDLSKAIVAEIPAEQYSGDEITPPLDIQLDGVMLEEGTDYDVTYADNIYAGKASATVTGVGNYTGSITVNFNIYPKEVDTISAKPADNDITLEWSGNNGAEGYKIYRKDTYKGSYKRIKTLPSGDTISYKNTNLLADHEYYYRIRSYVKIDGKTYYSSYTPLTAATMTSKQAAIVSAKMNLLKKPAANAARLTTLPKNSTVEYLGRTYIDETTSFLHIKYVVKSKTYNGYLPTDALLKFYSSGNTTTNLNMRKAAGTNKKILTVIPVGTPVVILKTVTVDANIWYKTNYLDGSKLYTGFVSSTYIK